MTIISCIKQVQDLDMVLANDWFIGEDGLSIDIQYANKIMNTYDETALELMLRITDQSKDIQTGVITVGNKSKEAILRKSLAVGVNKATRVEYEDNLTDSPSYISRLLFSVIRKLKDVDLVLCGRQADNSSHGLTGQFLAERLGWPCFTMVTEISCCDGIYSLSRVVDKGIEQIMVKGPIVVTVTQSSNKFLRMATLKATMDAKRKDIEVVIPDRTFEKDQASLNIVSLKVNKPDKKCIFLQDQKDKNIQTQLHEIMTENSLERGILS